MGLLDDAIREHLELKRQHGADPDEVSRQEQEALGAPRKAEFARPEGHEAETADAGEAPATDEAVLAEPPADVPEPIDAPEPFDVDALGEREPEAVEPPPEPEAAAPGYDEDPWLADERDEVPAGETLDHPRRDEPEPEAEPKTEAQPEPGEDVLEETPDFLQETPEHDRLWFEQRPPRDFDWDK